MRRFILCALLCVSLCGCQNSQKITNEQNANYNEFKTSLINNAGAVTYTLPFSYSISIDKVNSKKYSYTVVVKNPDVAMIDIQMMVLNPKEVSKNKMEPSIGIIDDSTVSMIPNQVNSKKGYPKGIALNGICKSSDFQIYCMITWYNEDKTQQSRGYFTFNVENGEDVG